MSSQNFGDTLKSITNRVKNNKLKEYVKSQFPIIENICIDAAEKGKYKAFYIENNTQADFTDYFNSNGLGYKYTDYPCGCTCAEECGGGVCDYKGYEISWETKNNKELCKKLFNITEKSLKDQKDKHIIAELEKIKKLCMAAAEGGETECFYETKDKLTAFETFFRINGVNYEYETYFTDRYTTHSGYTLSW